MTTVGSIKREVRVTPRDDATATMVWLGTRLVVFAAAWVGGLALLQGDGGISGYLALWDRWETPYYQSIAEVGYFPEGEYANNAAYFPGLALAIRFGLLIGVSPPAAGMAVAIVAGLAASLALARLTCLWEEAVSGAS